MQNGGCTLVKEAPPMGRGAVSIGVVAMQPGSLAGVGITRRCCVRTTLLRHFWPGNRQGDNDARESGGLGCGGGDREHGGDAGDGGTRTMTRANGEEMEVEGRARGMGHDDVCGYVVATMTAGERWA